jgi:polysaccharide export outer membrane protein
LSAPDGLAPRIVARFKSDPLIKDSTLPPLAELLRKSLILRNDSIPDKLKKLLAGKTNKILLLSLVLSSCASYKKNIMFKVPEGYQVKQLVDLVERNYVIQKNDYLQLEVYTNKGERIIDPDLELSKELNNQNMNNKPEPIYLVDINGVAKFPMVGEIKIEGLTIRLAEELLQKAYEIYYKDSFVILKYTNKRVIVLGAPGGQVVPLVNENVHLAEVLALAKGVDNLAQAQNIRVLRGEQVLIADLSTIEGYIKNNILIEHGDIVYVEPIRRPFSEAMRDYLPILTAITSLTTLIVVIAGL